METVEIRAFVPARDFDLSKRFYQDVGFTLNWSSEDLAYFEKQDIAGCYRVQATPPEDRPWGIRDFVLIDPTGVLWRIGQTIGEPRSGA